MSQTHASAIDPILDPAVHARRWQILGVMCLSLLVVMLANTSMNVALPILSGALGATSTDLQWIVDSYSLVFAGLLFTAGTIGDRYGRKLVLQIGLVVFGVASVIATFLVSTPGQLIATRALMGLGGALVMPATLSILTNVFPREERAKAVAMWAGISGAGTALGPVLSGFLLEHYSWASVFALNIPFIAIAIVMVWKLVPRSRNADEAPDRRSRRPAVDHRRVDVGLRDHRSSGPRLAGDRDARCRRHRSDRTGGVRLVGAASREPDARRAAVQDPGLRRLVARAHPRVLHADGHLLQRQPAAAARLRLLAARRLGARCSRCR